MDEKRVNNNEIPTNSLMVADSGDNNNTDSKQNLLKQNQNFIEPNQQTSLKVEF